MWTLSLRSIQKCKISWDKHCTWSAESNVPFDKPSRDNFPLCIFLRPLWESDLVTASSASLANHSFQGTNKFELLAVFLQSTSWKIKNIQPVWSIWCLFYSISLAGLWYKYSLPEYISPSVLDRGNPSKRQACKILNILWNLSEVNHLIFRDFAIYKSQPIKPTSQAVTAVVCQTFFIGKKHDHPYIYHLFGVSTRGLPRTPLSSYDQH